MTLLTQQKKQALLAAKKARGTLEKVITMITEDQYCPDIIQQLDAVTGLLTSSKRTLLKGHLDHCLAVQLKKDKDQTVKELLEIYRHL